MAPHMVPQTPKAMTPKVLKARNPLKAKTLPKAKIPRAKKVSPTPLNKNLNGIEMIGQMVMATIKVPNPNGDRAHGRIQLQQLQLLSRTTPMHGATNMENSGKQLQPRLHLLHLQLHGTQSSSKQVLHRILHRANRIPFWLLF